MKTLGIRDSGAILASPDYVQPIVLATGTSNAQAIDTPAGSGYAIFSFNQDFWVRFGSTAATAPSTTGLSSQSSGSELNPTARNFGSTLGCTGISIASEYVTKGSIAWYSKP